MKPNLGLLALLAALVGLLTGPFLALHYAPTFESAHDSIAHLQREVALGGTLRGLHHWAGTFAIVLATLHGLRLFWHGRYKAPRQRLWVLGGLILLVLLSFAHSGYLLAGDERAHTGLQVAEGVARSTPIVGPAAARLLTGGDGISSATLVRIHAVHTMFLPVLLAVLVWAFVTAWRRSDDPPPELRTAISGEAVWGIAVCALLAAFAILLPAPLGPKADVAGAGAGASDARPEWFFLWINQLLRSVGAPAFVFGAVVPGLLVLGVLGLPWMSRSVRTQPRHRIPELALAAGVLAALTVLSILSLQAPAAEPAAPTVPADQGDLAARASAALERFQCAGCHRIDGDANGGDQGPPLDRDGFEELYTREFFRRKVGDPVGFWPDTSMRYTPMRLKPSAEELAALEWWFFRDE